MTLAEELAGWASGLRLADVPSRVVGYAKSQVLSQLAAARAGLHHDLGRRITAAFGGPLQDDPVRSAYVLAALTMTLDFDDTVYAGHVSHSTVDVPLAYARRLRLDGERLLAAIVAANECAARITAAATLGPFRGQTAAHTHLAGAVAGRLHAEMAPAEAWVAAWGLAFAMPPWALSSAFLGSDAKVLTAATPVRTALDACDAASAGLRALPDLFEQPDGFLKAFATAPLPDAVVAGLGTRWHTETLSFKVHPGCAYIDAAIDCAVALHGELGGANVDGIDEVSVHASVFTLGMDARSARFVHGAESPVSTLNFSIGYNVATALLTGALTPGDFSPGAISDPGRWALAGKVHVAYDHELTTRAVLATAPLGEALRQAGERAGTFLAAFGDAGAEIGRSVGSPSEDFTTAEKAIGARVEVRLADGRVLVQSRDIAVGAAGPDTRRDHPRLMREKFLACGGAAEVADAIARLEELPAGEIAEALERTLGA